MGAEAACQGAARLHVEGHVPERIRTERLLLRPFHLSDGPAVLAYSADAHWQRYQQTTPRSQEEAAEVADGLSRRDPVGEPAWAITLEGRVIGLVSLVFSADRGEALLGYGLHARHRGRGMTQEAVSSVLAGAFGACPGLARVTARTHAGNGASIRLLARLGFVRRDDERMEGEPAGATFELSRSRWLSRGPKPTAR